MPRLPKSPKLKTDLTADERGYARIRKGITTKDTKKHKGESKHIRSFLSLVQILLLLFSASPCLRGEIVFSEAETR